MTSKNDDNSSDTSSLASELDLISLMDSIDTTKEDRGEPADEVNQKMVEFCDQIEETLRLSKLGYVDTSELAAHVFQDHGVDANQLSQKFGFNTFEQFMRSEWMKSRVDIDDTDDMASYHYPIAKIREQNEPVLMAPFLAMHTNRKIYQRNGGRRSECPDIDQFLTRRWYKRNGMVDPEDLKPKKPAPVGRGRGGAMAMRARESKQAFDDKSTTSSPTARGGFTQPMGRGRGFAVGMKRGGGTWADGKSQGRQEEEFPKYKPGSSKVDFFPE